MTKEKKDIFVPAKHPWRYVLSAKWPSLISQYQTTGYTMPRKELMVGPGRTQVEFEKTMK